jgi:hypothetical protein
MDDREKKLEIALEECMDLDAAMRAMTDWLSSAEGQLSQLPPVARLLEPLHQQLQEHMGIQVGNGLTSE